MHKPPRKWTVVAAFILAVMLHAGAVAWVEMQQEKPSVDVGASIPSHSVEDVTFETGRGSGLADIASYANNSE
jgi:hypothetical protein